jgi:hypothetical protein
MQTTPCDKCGHEIQLGEHPFCPHGFPIKGITVLDDSIPGGETIENLAPTPITFYSKSDKRRYLKEHGIREKVRHVGEQGTDKSRFTSRWI